MFLYKTICKGEEAGAEWDFEQGRGHWEIVSCGLNPGSSGIKSYHKVVLNL